MKFLVKTQRSKTSLKRKVQKFSKIILDWSGSWTFLPPLIKPLWYLPFGFLSGTLQVWFSWASTTMFRELLLSLIGVQGKVKTLLTFEFHFIFITCIFSHLACFHFLHRSFLSLLWHGNICLKTNTHWLQRRYYFWVLESCSNSFQLWFCQSSTGKRAPMSTSNLNF